MKNADFWRTRKNEFRRLAEYEYRMVPDPADRRRLYAYGDYTIAESGAAGTWTLVGGLSADFRTEYEEAASSAGFALLAGSESEPLQFWLHSLVHFLIRQEEEIDERGHLAVWDAQRGGVIRDVPAASVVFCSWLIRQAGAAGPAMGPPAKVPRRRIARRETSDANVEKIRQRARQMLAEGASHREICQRLGSAPRPPRTTWNHLPWDKAYKEERFRSSVCKWLSKNCRP